MTQQVSTEYIEGIKDGRQYLNRFKPCMDEVKEIIANLRSTMKTFSPGPVKDLLKGERDFWVQQMKSTHRLRS